MTQTRLQEFTSKNRGSNLNGRFLCLEINPPRGTEYQQIFDRLESLGDNLKKIDFLNITDSALARMKAQALPFASIIKNKFGIEPLVNFSCRDRNSIAIQADLLAGWMLGVKSVVALTGDAVTLGDNPKAKGVFEVNSCSLLKIIETLNLGKDIVGNDLTGGTSYSKGVVVNPNANNIEVEVKRLKKKIESGADYALSQPVFDLDLAVSFFTVAKDLDFPILAGLLPFKTLTGLKSMANVPGIKVSDSFILEAEGKNLSDLSGFSIEHCLELSRGLTQHVAGFHVISGNSPKLGVELIKRLGEELER